MARWNSDAIIQLINCYEQYPILYNIRHNEYKNKIKRETAFEKLFEDIKSVDGDIPIENIEGLKKKVKSLRDTYTQEYQKVIKSQEKIGSFPEDLYVLILACEVEFKIDENKKAELIELVRDQLALWDQSSTEYNIRIKDKQKLWEGISQTLAIDVEVAKKTWGNMRDYFQKELKNVLKTTTGMAAVDKYASKWLYWKPLLFMVLILHPRLSEGNLNLIEELTVNTATEDLELDATTFGPSASDADFCNNISSSSSEEFLDSSPELSYNSAHRQLRL